ncbi:BglG family transcription antiterminator [Ignavigranum ruoffiae]|uniref:BglG family transcription antiterminator n=1 Tax=Ignavigranum ruoffiae TaxID=89093 RepID=UPI0024ACAFDF|nr:PTS sugar transporter subunit IIA [Ignavigranum ruoffiae]
MDQDVLFLLYLLLVQPNTTHDELMTLTNSSKRQIEYRLNKINDYLSDENLPKIEIINKENFIIDKSVKQVLIDYLFNNTNYNHYIFSKDERIVYIYLWLFHTSDYISLQHFMYQLDVSKSTVLSDIDYLSDKLKQNNLQINYSRTEGYHLSGEEIDLRKFMIQLIIKYCTTMNGAIIFNRIIEDFKLTSFEENKKNILALSKIYDIKFVEKRLIEFIYIYIFLTERFRSKKNISSVNNYFTENIDFSNFKEYLFAKKLLAQSLNINRVDIHNIEYISSWLIGVSVGNIDENTKDKGYILSLVNQIINRVQLISGISFSSKNDITKLIYSHFRPAFYRLVFDIPFHNPLTEKILDEYPGLHQIVKEAVKPISDIIGREIDEDELSLLTLNFSILYSFVDITEKRKRIKASIVCLNGLGTSVLILNTLKEIFTDFLFLDPVNLIEFNSLPIKPDIIFSTHITKELLQSKIPVIKVNPIMTYFEKELLIREVTNQLGLVNYVNFDIKQIQNILLKNDINDIQANKISRDISSFISRNYLSRPTQIKTQQLSLLDLIDLKNITIQEKYIDPIIAIKNLANIMIDNKVFNQEYQNRIIEIQRKNPKYFVISHGVALPHANSKKDVFQNRIGISLLKKPTNFDNKPVYLIFLLACADKNIHISAMGELLEFISNPVFINNILKCNNQSEIYNLFRSNTVN